MVTHEICTTLSSLWQKEKYIPITYRDYYYELMQEMREEGFYSFRENHPYLSDSLAQHLQITVEKFIPLSDQWRQDKNRINYQDPLFIEFSIIAARYREKHLLKEYPYIPIDLINTAKIQFYWSQKGRLMLPKESKTDGILASLAIIFIAVIITTLIYIILYSEPQITMLIICIIVGYFTLRTILRDIWGFFPFGNDFYQQLWFIRRICG